MASIIPAYEYDIFISYRQKDNKGDKWVSKFVDALKTELEATFKEDVSVYFDENPHDRLQETHNVDKSLEGKLKCLIFIPILSQTYCDPNSYAWQYEFLAFIKMAENDRFGKDVKLRSGNVTGRIFPVRIHDLEPEDVKLFEKETKSVLRALDFVFKTSAGVNRPLRVNEDHPNDNLNKTFYSDQINKVANAIKEIILGLKAEAPPAAREKILHTEPFEEVHKEQQTEKEKPARLNKRKLLSGISILAILIIAAVLTYPKLFKRDTLERLISSGERISVVVMPFQNMTNDTTWNVWQDGIQNELITSLTNSEELKVRQTESINNLIQSKGLTNYSSITPSIASYISKKLDANIFIYGSIKQVGNTIRVNAQLIDSKTEDTFKSFQIDGTAENILHITDSLSRIVKDFLILTKLKKEVSPIIQQFHATTRSPAAYRLYINGMNAFMKRDFSTARNRFLEALEIDSNFMEVLIALPFAFDNQGLKEEGRYWARKVYERRDKMTMEQHKIFADFIHAAWFETPNEEIKYLKQYLEEVDDQSVSLYWQLGLGYFKLHQYDKTIPEMEKSLEIYHKWGIKPEGSLFYNWLGGAYHITGQYKKEKQLYKKAQQDFPDDPSLMRRQAILLLSEGDTVEANRHIEKCISIRKENSETEAEIASSLASIYDEAEIPDKAEEYYRKALSLNSESPEIMDNLAYFLIDKDRNTNEGLELVDKALILRPDNYNFLDTKGWGLYKQGNYKDALGILQKSWDLRRQHDMYFHEAFLHLEEAKKAVASQK